jgi:predicted dehydrogenase
MSCLCADFTKFGAGQRLEDDANLLVHYKAGARGIIHCSKISAGEENRLNIRAYGTHASIEWDQEHSNELIVKYPDASRRTLRRAMITLAISQSGSLAWFEDNPKALSRRLQTSTLKQREQSVRRLPGREFPKIVIFPTSRMALLEWPSLKQQSKAQQTEARGRR